MIAIDHYAPGTVEAWEPDETCYMALEGGLSKDSWALDGQRRLRRTDLTLADLPAGMRRALARIRAVTTWHTDAGAAHLTITHPLYRLDMLGAMTADRRMIAAVTGRIHGQDLTAVGRDDGDGWRWPCVDGPVPAALMDLAIRLAGRHVRHMGGER